MRARETANTNAITISRPPSPSYHRPLPPSPHTSLPALTSTTARPRRPAIQFHPHDYLLPSPQPFDSAHTTIQLRSHIKRQPPTYPDKTANTYSQNRWTTKVIHPTRLFASPPATARITPLDRSSRPSQPLATSVPTVHDVHPTVHSDPIQPLTPHIEPSHITFYALSHPLA